MPRRRRRDDRTPPPRVSAGRRAACRQGGPVRAGSSTAEGVRRNDPVTGRSGPRRDPSAGPCGAIPSALSVALPPAAAMVLRESTRDHERDAGVAGRGGAGLPHDDRGRGRPGHQLDGPLRVRAQRRTRAAAFGRARSRHPPRRQPSRKPVGRYHRDRQTRPQTVDLALRPAPAAAAGGPGHHAGLFNGQPNRSLQCRRNKISAVRGGRSSSTS